MNIDYEQASRQLSEELHQASRELGVDWAITETPFFIETPHKNYTARAESTWVYSGEQPSPTIRRITAILFRPDDHTGDNPRLPRRKEGEAELFISIGSKVNQNWVPGLTCLELWTSRGDASTFKYNQVTSHKKEFLESLQYGPQIACPRRFDFTFDRARNFGDPHLTTFKLNLATHHFNIDYQIGAFVAFHEPCRELDLLRKKVDSSRG